MRLIVLTTWIAQAHVSCVDGRRCTTRHMISTTPSPVAASVCVPVSAPPASPAMSARGSWGRMAAERGGDTAGMGSRASSRALTPRPLAHAPPAHLLQTNDTAAVSLDDTAAVALDGAAAAPLDAAEALAPRTTPWYTWQTDGLRSEDASWVNASVRDCAWEEPSEAALALGAAQKPAEEAPDEPGRVSAPDYTNFPAWTTQPGECLSRIRV